MDGETPVTIEAMAKEVSLQAARVSGCSSAPCRTSQLLNCLSKAAKNDSLSNALHVAGQREFEPPPREMRRRPASRTDRVWQFLGFYRWVGSRPDDARLRALGHQREGH